MTAATPVAADIQAAVRAFDEAVAASATTRPARRGR
jgi:hypothetical protein